MPFVGIAQKKRDNTIMILQKININELKLILFQNGYSFDNSDTVFLKTSSRELESAVAVKFIFYRTDTSTYVKGWFKPTISIEVNGIKTDNDFSLIEYTGMKGSYSRDAWNELERISKLISPNILFIRQ